MDNSNNNPYKYSNYVRPTVIIRIDCYHPTNLNVISLLLTMYDLILNECEQTLFEIGCIVSKTLLYSTSIHNVR